MAVGQWESIVKERSGSHEDIIIQFPLKNP